ncbi:MAG: hypothetical protein ABH862_06870 [Candidatus Omnitrophota bacterium]
MKVHDLNIEKYAKIKKPEGFTPTEKLLGDLCDKTFLKLWSYLNPYKDDGKELCDLLVVFENHVFIFFDRESKRLIDPSSDFQVSWSRWKKEVIDKQIKTALGAERYIKSKRGIYLDNKQQTPFPIPIPQKDIQIHKIIIAHGASEACRAFSKKNITGSLAITYAEDVFPGNFPFIINLHKNDLIHVFDSENIRLIFNELDTFYDFKTYILKKEKAISDLHGLTYCGEEDLLAHYYLNFDSESNCHFIGVKDKNPDLLCICEGEWVDFVKKRQYKLRKKANEVSYFWDHLIQKTSEFALKGEVVGNAKIYSGDSAIREMAKEPRFHRRALSARMIEAIRNFPDNVGSIFKSASFTPSFYSDTGYAFLQLKVDEKGNYEKEYRPRRRAMLTILCGVVKNMFPELNKVVGIAIDAPKFAKGNSEDFLLLKCDDWSEEDRKYYEEQNKALNFFKTKATKIGTFNVSEFPDDGRVYKRSEFGRNEEPCP